jgi:TM2 domain-containing membrane protein YozV
MAFSELDYVGGMTADQRTLFASQYNASKKNRTTALLLNLFLGFFGIHRFYLGQIGLGLLFLLTLGVFFLGAIVDLFVIMGSTDRHNARLASDIAARVRSLGASA